MSDPRLCLNDLDAVIAVARRASFRQASIDLGVSTTALSNTIARLEAHLATRLFNRTTRSVSLTEAGRLFLEQVGPALQDVRAALDAVQSHSSGPSGYCASTPLPVPPAPHCCRWCWSTCGSTPRYTSTS